MAKRIAVLSDTHGLLRPEVLDAIAGCDAIIHGGDINKPEIIDRLKEIAPVYVVRGNNDKEWAEHLPVTLTFQIEDCRFFLVHNKKEVPKTLTGIDAVIFGHSHRYFEQVIDGRLWLNPGSCGKRRFDQEITFAILTVEGKTVSTEKISIPHKENPAAAPYLPFSAADTPLKKSSFRWKGDFQISRRMKVVSPSAAIMRFTLGWFS